MDVITYPCEKKDHRGTAKIGYPSKLILNLCEILFIRNIRCIYPVGLKFFVLTHVPVP